MTQATHTFQSTSKPHPLPFAYGDDRYKRYAVAVLGRFMRADKTEYPCKLTKISVADATLAAPVDCDLGERIVVYVDHIGGLEGRVSRNIEGGFVINLDITEHKREKLAAQLIWYLNQHELDLDTTRRHPRYEMVNKSSKLLLPDAGEVTVQLIDVSISGASVRTDQRPPVGTPAQLGKLRARVVRHHSKGIALEFVDIQRPDALRKYFG